MLSFEELLTEDEGEDAVDHASDTSDMQLSDRPRGVVHIGCSGTWTEPLLFVAAVVVVVVVKEETVVNEAAAAAAAAALAAATSRGDRLMACA